MFVEAIRELLEREPHVLEADFLADDIEGHRGMARMHGAHHSGQHRAVADACIEQPQRRRARADVGEFHGDAVGDHPLLTAGVHEEQIFLAIVEEAEIRLAGSRLRHGHQRPACRGGGVGCDRSRAQKAVGEPGSGPCTSARGLAPAGGHEGSKPRKRVDGDASAIAQAGHELAVIDGEAPESRLGKPSLATEIADLAQNLVRWHRPFLPSRILPCMQVRADGSKLQPQNEWAGYLGIVPLAWADQTPR